MVKRNERKKRGTTTKAGKNLRAVYAKSRQQFGASDLQKFTEVEPGIPLRRVIADMERVQGRFASKKS